MHGTILAIQSANIELINRPRARDLKTSREHRLKFVSRRIVLSMINIAGLARVQQRRFFPKSCDSGYEQQDRYSSTPPLESDSGRLLCSNERLSPRSNSVVHPVRAARNRITNKRHGRTRSACWNIVWA
jgi:hypothetical protein